MPECVYTRLVGTEALRLLVLEPGSWSDELRGTLIHVSSPEGISEVTYEAVSYTWGDTSITESITIDEAILNIPKGVSDALRRLRSLQKPRTLWMDCVCIDQHHIQERNEQV